MIRLAFWAQRPESIHSTMMTNNRLTINRANPTRILSKPLKSFNLKILHYLNILHDFNHILYYPIFIYLNLNSIIKDGSVIYYFYYFNLQTLLLKMDNPENNNPLDQFNTLCVIGKGSYAKVVLVRKKSNGNLYALKSMKKKYI